MTPTPPRLPTYPLTHLLSCRFDDMVRLEPKMLGHHLHWCRESEGAHAEDRALRAGELGPAESRSRLDRDPGLDLGWQHAVPVVLGLLVEDLPRREAHHPGADSFLAEPLPGLQAERHLAPGGEQEHVGLSVRGVGQDVAAAGDAARRSEIGAIESGKRLTSEDQTDRPVLDPHDDPPALDYLVG